MQTSHIGRLRRVQRMSSELVKYLQKKLEEDYFLSEEDFVRLGFNLAIGEVKLYEAQQMKEPFYRDRMLEYINEKIEFMTAHKSLMGEYDEGALDQLEMMKDRLTKWAIEEEKMKEDSNGTFKI